MFFFVVDVVTSTALVAGDNELNPKTISKLLSGLARTSQANILHLDQKAAKCTTCNQLCVKF